MCLLLASCTVGAQEPGAPKKESATQVRLDYIDKSFTLGFVLRPRQMLSSRFGRMAGKEILGDKLAGVQDDFSEAFGVDLASVEQLSVLYTEAALARTMGFNLSQGGGFGDTKLLNRLKQIGLGFHMYHDSYRKFPDAKGKLSWRVLILPFIEQQELYEKFNLNEPWDSKHNKTLIKEMPDIFKIRDDGRPGHTSVHVFAGENGPFAQRVAIDDVTDGTSNTLMTAIAGVDKACEWTKPGGLEIDETNPWKSFGKVGNIAFVGFMDGSVSKLPMRMDSDVLGKMLTHNGREVFDYDWDSGPPSPQQNPTLVAHCSKPIDKRAAVETVGQGYEEPVKKKANGQEYWDVGGYAIWFPNDRTLVATQSELLPKLMANRNEKSAFRELVAEKGLTDVVFAADLNSMSRLKALLLRNNPVKAFKDVSTLVFTVDLTSAKVNVFDGRLGVDEESSARALQGMVAAGVAFLHQQLKSGDNLAPGVRGTARELSKLTSRRVVQRTGETVTYSVAKPKDYDKFLNDLQPELAKMGEVIRRSLQSPFENR